MLNCSKPFVQEVTMNLHGPVNAQLLLNSTSRENQQNLGSYVTVLRMVHSADETWKRDANREGGGKDGRMDRKGKEGSRDNSRWMKRGVL